MQSGKELTLTRSYRDNPRLVTTGQARGVRGERSGSGWKLLASDPERCRFPAESLKIATVIRVLLR
jgi:hypothetical protein